MAAPDPARLRWRVAVIAVGLVLLSACKVDIDLATEVEEDGSGTMTVTLLLGETVRSTLREGGLVTQDPEELRKIIESEGQDAVFSRGPDPVEILAETVPPEWDVEEVAEGNVRGLALRSSFSALDEIPELLAPFDDWGDEIAARQGADAEQGGVPVVARGFTITRDGPVFRFRGEPNAEAYEGATGGPNNLLAEFTISVKLPGGVREHDADEKEDGALIWHIVPGSSRTISATSDLTYDPREFPTVPLAVGASVAGLAGLLALRHVRGRRRNGSGPPGPDVPDSEPVPV